MRSSLGAPHSTERCKITNFLQRGQIFTAFFCIIPLYLGYVRLCQYNISSKLDIMLWHNTTPIKPYFSQLLAISS